jgi:hypothetical protein
MDLFCKNENYSSLSVVLPTAKVLWTFALPTAPFLLAQKRSAKKGPRKPTDALPAHARASGAQPGQQSISPHFSRIISAHYIPKPMS